ncbi:hypothetical protein F2Q69_00020458 [Brassica cretica]|uniref:Uncharacterized protein n=1 Tax=Brassica cretica TaxID=69181 RepID=A0A8S9QF03_BRACR|nr:hypothetical protein F2Q69_00020458 [Brassica cretica]
MRYEFSPEFTSYEIQELYPRRYLTHGSKEARKVVAQEGQRVFPKEDNFQPNQGHAIVHFLDQKSDIPKAMKMSKSVGQNTLIRSKGKPEQAIVQVKAKVSPILDKSFHESSTTCMMHLSLSKSVITGIKEPTSHGDDTPRENLLMDQKDKQSKLFKEAKPRYHMRAICLLNSQGPTQNMSSIKIHTTSRNRNLNKELFKCPNLRGSEIVTGNQGGNKPNKEQEVLTAIADIKYIQFRGRNFIKGQGMMRSSNQQLDQSVTKPSKPTTMEIPATEVQYKENISTTRSLKSEELEKEKPRCNQFPKTGQTDINLGKFPSNSIWADPNLSMGEPGDTLENSEDIQDILSCTSIQRIRRILFTINFPYLDAFTPFTCKESLHQLMAKEQRPYSSSKPFRDISGRLLDQGQTQGFVCIHPWRCRSEVVGSSLTYQLGGRRCGRSELTLECFHHRLGDGLIPSGRARYLERLCGCFVYVVCVGKKSLEFQGCDLKEKFRVSRMCRLWLLLLFSCFAHPLSCPRHCNIVLFWPLVLELSVSALFVFLRLSNEVVDAQLGPIMFCALDPFLVIDHWDLEVLVGSPRVCYLLPLSFQHLELHSQWRRKVWEDRHELTPVMARDISSIEETR